MPRLRTKPSRWAAVALIAIGLLFVQRLATSTTLVYSILSGVLVVASLAAGLKMLAHNCFESHLVAALVVAATAGSTLLLTTVGLPGDGAAHLSAVQDVLFFPSASIMVLLMRGARVGREPARRTRQPYARG